MANSRCESGLLSVEEAAAYLHIAVGTLRNWLSMKRVEYVKVGRLTRICVDVLEKFIANHTVKSHDTV